jgi:hypothetical protein
MPQEKKDSIPPKSASIPATQTIPSSEIDSKQPEMFIVGVITTETANLSNGAKVSIENEIIIFDRQALDKEKEIVLNFLKDVINRGDEAEFKNFLWYLEDSEDPKIIESKKQMQKAFDNKDAGSLFLKNIQISLPTEQIAQRRLIKEKLRLEMDKYPFTFRDKLGNPLNPDTDLDFIFMKNDDGKGFKLLIASELGIDSIDIPQDNKNDQFQPNLNGITKSNKDERIIIPVLSAKDGSVPSVNFVEIRKGEIDLPRQLLEEEENIGKTQKSRSSSPLSANYSPPTPSPVSQPRSKRPSSYVTVSH